MKRSILPFVEHFGEATTACLLMMAQGGSVGFGLSHLLVASQVGLLAGGAMSVVLFLARIELRWKTAAALGAVTLVVDLVVHGGGIGDQLVEAALTGLGAALLSLLVGTLIDLVGRRRSHGLPIRTSDR